MNLSSMSLIASIVTYRELFVYKKNTHKNNNNKIIKQAQLGTLDVTTIKVKSQHQLHNS